MRRAILVRRVVGGSMSPTLKPGKLILATRHIDGISEGSIILFRHDGIEKVKRIKELKNDKYYVVGDNPEFSTDSRNFGWLPKEDVIAKIIWPRNTHKPI